MKTPTSPAELPLLATCWTITGDVLPTAVNALSPFPLERRMQAAAQAGFTGIGLWYGDLLQQEQQAGGFAALGRRLDALGFEFIELESLTNWFSEGETRRQSDSWRKLFLRAAAELGARHLKVIPPMPGQDIEHSTLVDAFGTLCREAAVEGLGIAMEMMPMAGLPTLAENLAVTQAAAAPNGGLLLDIWHLQRCGHGDFQDLAAIPASAVAAMELNDAPGSHGPDLFHDTLNDRLPCGEGDFDVSGFVRALWQAGYRGPVGVEILSPRFRALEPEEAARISHDTTRAALIASAAQQSSR